MTIYRRILLPWLMGAISLVLVAWDVHNQRVIRSMGMGWDDGAPIWPYQMPAIMLDCLNYPVHNVLGPITGHLGLATPKHYLLVFPATLLWWWFLGWVLDKRLTWQSSRRPWLLSVILAAVGIVILWGSIIALDDAFRWWFEYGGNLWSSRAMLLCLSLAPVVWGIVLSLMTVLAAERAILRQSYD